VVVVVEVGGTVVVDVVVEVDVLVELVVVVVGQHMLSRLLIIITSSDKIIKSSVIFVMSSVSNATSAATLHITLLNLSRIVFNPSQVFTSVQGRGVLSYVITLVPIIVILFISEHSAILYLI
jgi:hypothetical protein